MRTSYLGVEMIDINLWVFFSFSYKFLIFGNLFTNDPYSGCQGFQSNFKSTPKS